MVCVRLPQNINYRTISQAVMNPCESLRLRSFKGFEPSADVFIKSQEPATNPLLDAVKKAVPMIKEPRVKLADSMHDMIMDTTSSASDAMGKDAVVFPIPNHRDMVLRIEKSVLGKMDKLPEDLELVPIAYEKGISENPHLGLPLYYVTSKSSTIARKNTISPMEALAQPDKIMVLRRVTGEHPSAKVGDKFMNMIGYSDFSHPDESALTNFSYIFGYIGPNFGYKAVLKCLELCKNGVSDIPAHAIAEGSAPIKLDKGKEFYKMYTDFADSYVQSLKDISEIPQESYKNAVDFISSSKNFNVDFQHTNNTFVDLEKKEFNFMDFAYDKNDKKYIYANPVKEFRNVLFGKGFRRIDDLREAVRFLPQLRYPRDFIALPEHIEGIKKYSKTINDKINAAAPQEFQSPKVFS